MIKKFKQDHGRELHLEIEPGTFLVANSAILLSEVVDMVENSTPEGDGFHFIKLNTGLNDITRPALYGAQHEIRIIKKSDVAELSSEK